MSDEINTNTETNTTAVEAPKEVAPPVEGPKSSETPVEAPKEVSTPITEPTKVESSAENFLANLSDDLKGDKSLQKFKDVENLAKSYVELNSYLGKKFSDLSKEELEGYYNKLGRPDNEAGYKLPENVNEEVANWYKKTSFNLGLTETQAKTLADSFMELETAKISEGQNTQKATEDAWLGTLKEMYGNKLDVKVESAKRAVHQFGGQDLVDYLNTSRLGSHPAMIKTFVEIGEQMLEGTFVDGDAKQSFGQTKEESEQDIQSFYNDKGLMRQLQNPQDPHHRVAKEKFERLYKKKAKHNV